MSITAKICGLRTKEAANISVDNGAKFIGCVFYDRSPRNITPKQAADVTSDISGKAAKVAVVVNPDEDLLSEIMSEFSPEYIQLHGGESLAKTQRIKERYPSCKIIKAVTVRDADDIASARQFRGVADMLLFDARPSSNMPGALPGGNGLAFDWHLLSDRNFSIPWILSGGLSSENVKEAVRISGATMVDVSSSVEIEPGVKDLKLIEEFLTVVKAIG